MVMFVYWSCGCLEPESITLPETNMAPENNPMEKEITGNHHF